MSRFYGFYYLASHRSAQNEPAKQVDGTPSENQNQVDAGGLLIIVAVPITIAALLLLIFSV